MSDLLTNAAQALNVPEPLVRRSAEARAKANGTSTEAVLEAWAGGGSVAAAAAVRAPSEAPVAEPETAAEPEASAPAAQPKAPAPEPEPALAPAPSGMAAPAAVMVEVEEEPVEPVPLSARVRRSGRVGLVAGFVASLLVLLLSAPWLLPRATLTGEEGEFTPALEVVPGWLLGAHALVAFAIGLALAALTRTVAGWFAPGMRLVSSFTASLVVGGVAAALMGLLVAGVVVGTGAPLEGVEGVVVVPLLPAILWTILGWTATGWAVAALVQVMAVPEGVPEDEAEEVEPVRHRLASAYGIPAVSILAILVLVLPVAYLFISFPGYAPLLAMLVAGGILGFAGLSASRPGMRISAGEFLVAAAGIGVVVLIIVAVLNAQGAGHAEEEEVVEAGTAYSATA